VEEIGLGRSVELMSNKNMTASGPRPRSAAGWPSANGGVDMSAGAGPIKPRGMEVLETLSTHD